jgi:cytochrome c oxidase cbb3-type subunit III
MSDFTHPFWSSFIAVISVGGIVACLVLLWLTARTRVPAGQAGATPADPGTGQAAEPDPGAQVNDNTTGHVWDGDLREMNKPLPRWWVGLFVISVVFGLGYLLMYPGLGQFAGRLGWTSTRQYQSEVAQGEQATAPLYARLAAMSVQDLAIDAQAMAVGERLFMNQCAPCHGSDARGNKGIPNLTDSDWLHGGSPEQIQTSITQGRVGVMPPMAAAVGTPEDVKNLANYVLSLSNSPHDALRAALGRSKYAACAACHGPAGKGNPDLGAPNLSDDIWLHGYGETAIVAMINGGKTNIMPAQGDLLSAAQIHVLSAYVWRQSQPQPAGTLNRRAQPAS